MLHNGQLLNMHSNSLKEANYRVFSGAKTTSELAEFAEWGHVDVAPRSLTAANAKYRRLPAVVFALSFVFVFILYICISDTINQPS
jgi:hypothetical protein